MPSISLLTHAISFAIIGYVVRKYFYLKIELQKIEDALEKRDLLLSTKCQKLDGYNDDLSDDTYTKNVKISSEYMLSNHSSNYLDMFETRVWCMGKDRNQVCRFSGLCYHIFWKDFVFIHGDKPITEYNKNSEKLALYLSTVLDQNLYKFKYVDIPQESLLNLTVKWILEDSVIFSRHKPDNLMHVLHDDVIPLLYTLTLFGFKYENIKYNVNIVFSDNYARGFYYDFYAALSHHISSISALEEQSHPQSHPQSRSDLICFKNAYVGLFTTTLWYQYGFERPQGSIRNRMSSKLLQSFTDYIKVQLNVKTFNESSQENPYLVLISRRVNRKILNANELIDVIVTHLRLNVKILDEERMTIPKMVDLVYNSIGLIGMHGATMALSMFLRSGSIVVEMFPYAINPENYTPYKMLSELLDNNIVYKSWQNFRKENSIGYPENPQKFGGIFHLTKREQDVIINEDEVKPHLCCENPSWLYHIYQDTIVSVNEALAVIQTALSETKSARNQQTGAYPQLHPSVPLNVTCIYTNTTLKISWSQPWNLLYLKFTSLSYELLLLNKINEKSTAYIVDATHANITVDLFKEFMYILWVRSNIDGINGEYSEALYCT